MEISGNQLTISDGNTVTLPQSFSGDYNDLINTPTIPTVNNATLTIQKNGTSVGTFTANAGTNKTINVTVPTTTSELTNNSGFITASQVPAQVNADWNATSGAAQILNKPTIPTVNNGTLTIQQNGTSLGTFTANQSSNQTVNIETPTTADMNYLMDYFNAQISSMNDYLQTFSQDMQDSMANMHQQMDSLQEALDDMQEAFNDEDNFVCGVSKVKDYDGNVYNTVKIGSQCWMKENLRTTHYSNGVYINYTTDTSSTNARRYYPNNISSNVKTYGYLYNWPAVMHGSASSSANPSGVQGICPTGWHVPSNAEWTQLANYVSSQSQYLCNGTSTNIAKALASTTGWSSSTNTCAVGNSTSDNNATGFSAVPAGYRTTSYSYFGTGAYMWSATQYNSNQAYYRYFYNSSSSFSITYNPKWHARPVRCLRDVASLNIQVEQQQQQIEDLQNALDSLQNTLPNHYYVPSSGTKTIHLGSNVTSLMVYENSGPGANYANSWDGTLVLVSDASNKVFRITGSYEMENISSAGSWFDYVEFFNGSGTGNANNRIIRLAGTGSISDYIYTSGNTLTIRFHSDGSNVYDGIALSIAVVSKPSCTGAKAVDVEGNYYTTVSIGDQCWMKQSLRTKTYANFNIVTLKENATFTDTSSTYKYCYYPNNSSSNLYNYGYLYNWPAVMNGAPSSNSLPSGVQGICPSGWHVPSDAEWDQLETYVKSQSGYLCNSNSNYIAKALASTSGWNSSTNTCVPGNSPSSNNATGFDGRPAGMYNGTSPESFGNYAGFWTCTTQNSGNSWYRSIGNGIAYLYGNYYYKFFGYSVRCVRNP